MNSAKMAATIVGLTLTAALTACSIGDGGVGPAGPNGAELLRVQSAAAPEEIQEGGMVQEALNFEALSRMSTSVVLVQIDSAAEYEYLGMEHTLSRAKVTETIAGENHTGQTLDVWQVGTAESPMGMIARPFKTGQTYVAYISPLYFEKGKPLEQWVVSAQGSWIQVDAAFALDVPIAEGESLGIDISAGQTVEPKLESLILKLPETIGLKDLIAHVRTGWSR